MPGVRPAGHRCGPDGRLRGQLPQCGGLAVAAPGIGGAAPQPLPPLRHAPGLVREHPRAGLAGPAGPLPPLRRPDQPPLPGRGAAKCRPVGGGAGGDPPPGVDDRYARPGRLQSPGCSRPLARGRPDRLVARGGGLAPGQPAAAHGADRSRPPLAAGTPLPLGSAGGSGPHRHCRLSPGDGRRRGPTAGSPDRRRRWPAGHGRAERPGPKADG